jgi:uncharacterized protein DUF4154
MRSRRPARNPPGRPSAREPRRSSRCGLAFHGALAVVFACGVAAASDPDLPSPIEHQIKASFVYTVAKFVTWPDGSLSDPAAPIVFGVLGEDAFAAALEQIVAGKKVHGRNAEVRRVRALEDLESCSVLYVSRTEETRLREVLGALRGSSVLTLGEDERFARLGGIIGLGMSENMVRFEVNVDVARRAGLTISSQILKLGTIVRERLDRGGR